MLQISRCLDATMVIMLIDSIAGATMAPFLGYPAVFSPQDAFRLRRRNSSLENLNQVRGGIKKTVFFLSFSERARPPPPINLDAQIFSAKEILDSARPPPPFLAENSEKEVGI